MRNARYRLARALMRLAFKLDGSAWPTAPKAKIERSPWVQHVQHIPVSTGRRL